MSNIINLEILDQQIADAQTQVKRLKNEKAWLEVLLEEERWQLLVRNDLHAAFAELVDGPEIDFAASTVHASGHKLGCFCEKMHSVHLPTKRRRLIELCQKTGMRVIIVNSHDCIKIPIAGMVSHVEGDDDPNDSRWDRRGYKNPETR
jgi:hypothetical protein